MLAVEVQVFIHQAQVAQAVQVVVVMVVLIQVV
jgi:hypothetical protein